LNGATLIPSEGKYGISAIKQVLHTILNTRVELQSDLADGKLSIFEAVGLIDNGREFVKHAQGWRALVNEVRDLDEDVKQEVAAYLAAEGLIKNADTQVKWAIDVLVTLVRLIELSAQAPKIFQK
jgi:hypothetical protein